MVRAARPTLQCRFQFPDRGITRSPDGIGRQAHAGLAAIAFDFEPTQSAIDAMAYRGGRLRRPTMTLHLETDHAAASASRAAFCASSRPASARIFAPMIAPPQMTSRDLVLIPAFQP
jgi:hypothetical protein